MAQAKLKVAGSDITEPDIEQARKITKPFLERQKALYEAESAAREKSEAAKLDVEKEKLAAQGELMKAKAEFGKGAAEREQALYTKAEQDLASTPLPDFKPSEPDLRNYAQLGSLVMTMGIALGGAKGNALASISALSGALEGWNKGRKDVWEREIKKFQLEFNKIKTARDQIVKNLELGIKKLSAGNKAGLADIEAAKFISGSNSVIAKQIESGRLDAAYQTAAGITKMQTEADRIILGQAGKIARARQAKELAERQMASAERIAGLKAGGKSAGAAAGAIERMTQSMSQVSGAINSLASLPITTTGTVFGPSDFKSLFTIPLSALNNKVSDETAQMLRTRMVGVARGLASLETGGAATGLVGLTQKIEQGTDIPAGTPVRVALDKLAEMRRIVEDAARAALKSDKYSPSQKELIKENVQIVEHAIPFTQQDVLDSYLASQGKSLKVAKKDKNLSFTEYVNKYGLGKPKEPLTPVSAPPVEQGQSQGGWKIEEVGK